MVEALELPVVGASSALSPLLAPAAVSMQLPLSPPASPLSPPRPAPLTPPMVADEASLVHLPSALEVEVARLVHQLLPETVDAVTIELARVHSDVDSCDAAYVMLLEMVSQTAMALNKAERAMLIELYTETIDALTKSCVNYRHPLTVACRRVSQSARVRATEVLQPAFVTLFSSLMRRSLASFEEVVPPPPPQLAASHATPPPGLEEMPD